MTHRWSAYGGPTILTATTEEEWALVLRVFEASRSRRGDKGRDDRKFLEALHYFTVHNVTWRALPPQACKPAGMDVFVASLLRCRQISACSSEVRDSVRRSAEAADFSSEEV